MSPVACAPEDSASDACHAGSEDETGLSPEGGASLPPSGSAAECTDSTSCSGRGIAKAVSGACACECVKGFTGRDCSDVALREGAATSAGASGRGLTAIAAAAATGVLAVALVTATGWNLLM